METHSVCGVSLTVKFQPEDNWPLQPCMQALLGNFLTALSEVPTPRVFEG